jgi:hypothetical protein
MTVAVACEQLARLSTRRAVAANGGSFSSYFIFFFSFFFRPPSGAGQLATKTAQ